MQLHLLLLKSSAAKLTVEKLDQTGEVAIHRSSNSSNGFNIEYTISSSFQNCKQNFSRPSRSKVINDLMRVSKNEMAKILDPQNNCT
jgi:hypothetical protein